MLSKRNAQKWANALRSGKYKQTTGTLQDLKGYCCLGVACDIFIPKKKIERYNGFMEGTAPDNQKYCPKWLANVSNELKIKSGLDSFIDLNDNEGFTFDMIADIIELVYVHKAFD